ncbi:MAG: hypothetical protein J7L82_06285 [Staphylothermus sp.]|nr:hypothetical protein [Staphylothermus sp.]
MSYLVRIYNDFLYGKYSRALEQLQQIRVYGTTMSSYRKIHSLLTDVIERILSVISSKSPESIDQKVFLNIVAELTKIGLLIQYQKKRNLINRDLADGLYRVITELVRSIEHYRGKEDLEKIRIQTEALKLIIDGIVAFHYDKFRK